MQTVTHFIVFNLKNNNNEKKISISVYDDDDDDDDDMIEHRKRSICPVNIEWK